MAVDVLLSCQNEFCNVEDSASKMYETSTIPSLLSHIICERCFNVLIKEKANKLAQRKKEKEINDNASI